MIRKVFLCLLVVLFGVFLIPSAVSTAAAEAIAHHALTVSLDPVTHKLSVTDTITWPSQAPPAAVSFVLNGRLRIVRAEPAVTEVPLGDLDAAFGPGTSNRIPLKRYRLPSPAASVTLVYEGPMDFPLSDPREEYTRGFRETVGRVAEEGVYLAGGSFWYPRFESELVTFALDAPVPDGWHLISQGSGTSRAADATARWESGGTMDEIYLVGGPLQVFRDSAGAVETLVYLHEADASLANKYLSATAQYIEMYRSLIGPYPYGKFALVENFSETGYGMPTFTLLGPQVIRFPFILTSSYPHEILHNWWGNSVFVDYDSGNWSEGLTAYMADHLIQEQRGAGDEYRRATLQKYRDYVKTGRDFPLAEFRGRYSAATEAVGYGKTLMGFHMLRRSIGDEAFRTTMARFFREFQGRRASFRDLQRTAEATVEKSLGWIFDDLITRAGAPVLEIASGPSRVRRDGNRFVVEGTLRQTQIGAPFTIEVPVVVQTEGDSVTSVVRMEKAEAPFSVAVDAPPLVLSVDPHYDVFRRLDPRETPASIGQIFGEPAILAVLPADAPAPLQKGYRALVEGWQSPSHAVEVRLDTQVSTLPSDRAVWIVGRTNRFAPLFGQDPGLAVSEQQVEIDGETMPWSGHTLVAVLRHPANVEKAVGWIVCDPLEALPGLGRKLPHYGKYSYLGFEGDEPINTIKGQWRQSDSPLRVDLRPPDRRRTAVVPPAPEPRKALADLPPVFSQQALRDHVTFLASPALEGRGLGSDGLDKAARYIAERFETAGLSPGGDGGTYFQRFRIEKGADGKPHESMNVIGLLRGMRDDWRDQSVVLGAHYDHLGLGWPDVHAGDEGKIHPGADDNASGVAVLLELARVLGLEPPPRTIVFAAFTGEEAGRLGSRYYAAHPAAPLDQVIGVVNLDTVGRLGTEKLTVLGTGTATEWQHIFRGVGFVTGVESRNVTESLESSDQVSFTEKGVPAVQIFSTAHGDYHRPEDTADKIDVPGLVKVATFVKETMIYLAERPNALTNTIRASAEATPAPGGEAPGPAARRVSFGTVPDFGFSGPGVKVSGLVEGSPAAKAGIQAGDVILRVEDQEVTNLQGFSDILRGLSAGQTVRVILQRNGKELAVSVTLAQR